MTVKHLVVIVRLIIFTLCTMHSIFCHNDIIIITSSSQLKLPSPAATTSVGPTISQAVIAGASVSTAVVLLVVVVLSGAVLIVIIKRVTVKSERV